MKSIDINCDMGEGAGNDEQIMPFISSANIACGFHAGNEQSMEVTAALALRSGVAVGAHVSFDDKENFGRTEMHLPASMIYELMLKQISMMKMIMSRLNAPLRHVKPHGALYNMSARDRSVAEPIARAIYDTDPELILFGLSNSISLSAAMDLGLKTAAEVFADRSYQENGQLTPRNMAGALLKDDEAVKAQLLQLINTQSITALSGKEIRLKADTICIHGDGEHAVSYAKTIHDTILKHSIAIKAI